MATVLLHDNISDVDSQINELENKRKRLVRLEKSRAKSTGAETTARKARTRRLIRIGALSDKYLETQGKTPEQIEDILARIVRADAVKAIISEYEESKI
jgi:hypothetical protein